MTFYHNFLFGGTQQCLQTKSLVLEDAKNATENLVEEAPEELPVIRDGKNRRIITKEILLSGQFERPPRPRKKPKNYKEYTSYSMQKTQSKPAADKAVDEPLILDKAVRIMAKMGWQGGALGRRGVGIIEPIKANTVYAQTKIGRGKPKLGLRTPEQPPQPLRNPQPVPTKGRAARRSKYFTIRMNLLNIILEFVQNDFETEIMFDSKLTSVERKNIHEVVTDLAEYEPPDPNDNSLTVKGHIGDTFYEIRKYDSYVLQTQSEGAGQNRALCLYKAAPEHMYLVTHHDLRDEPELDSDESIHTDDDFSDFIMQCSNANNQTDSKLSEVNAAAKISTESVKVEMVTNGTKKENYIKTNSIVSIKSDNEIQQHIKTECTDTENQKNSVSLKSTTLTNEMFKTDNMGAEMEEKDMKIVNVKNEKDMKTVNVKNEKDMKTVNVKHEKDMKTVNVKTNKETSQYIETDCSNTDTQIVSELSVDDISAIEPVKSESAVSEVANNEECIILSSDEDEDEIEQTIADEDTASATVRRMHNGRRTNKQKQTKQRKPVLVKARTTNIKKPLNESEIQDLILELFSDFCNDKMYRDFKFLGSFSDPEMNAIDEFINNVWLSSESKKNIDNRISNLIKNAGCEIRVRNDYNGSAVIFKV